MAVDSATNYWRRQWLQEQLRTGLLASALALSHLLEGEMARALAIVPLGARGLVVLLEIASEPPRRACSVALRRTALTGVARARCCI